MAVPAVTGDPVLDTLIATRNNLLNAMQGESLRWANAVAAGQEPPMSYSLGGRSLTYTEWMSAMNDTVNELNKSIIARGGEDGTFGDVVVHGVLH